MKIIAQHIEKRFIGKAIFRNINFTITPDEPLAILGVNGSGKSTLLKIIAGMISPDKGSVNFFDNTQKKIPQEKIYKHIAFVAAYTEIIEEFSLEEMLLFQASFVSPVHNMSVSQIIEILRMGKHKHKMLKKFSSGMKQKVKIALAVLFSKDILLLDEPCTNMDNENSNWYNELLQKYLNNRLLIVCSNKNSDEYSACKQTVALD